jgi:hypothetical protein
VGSPPRSLKTRMSRRRSPPLPRFMASVEVSLSRDPIAGPDRGGQGTMDDAVETCAQRVCDHLRRPIPGSRNLLMVTAGNTVNEIVPQAGHMRPG